MAGLDFAFTADNQGFMRSLREIQAGVNSTVDSMNQAGIDIDNFFSKLASQGLKLAGILGVATGAKEFAGQVFGIRDEFQKLEITFNTLLGSEEKTVALMNQLIETAAITPFAMTDVTEGAKSLLAYGVAAEDVNKTLVGLGDIAAGLKIPLTDLTYLYGTTITQGRMFTQDLRQFQGRGIPIAEELAKVLGKPKEKIDELVTAGQVTSEVFIKAMRNMSAEGSKFGGLMEAQSKSLGGQYENIKDTIEQIFNDVGKSSEGLFNTVLSATGTSLEFIQEHLNEISIAVATAIAAFGANKAATMLFSGFQNAKTNYAYTAEIEQLTALLPVKEKAAQSDLEAAVASGRLTEARAGQIAALREEAQARLSLLAAKEEEAKAELASATAEYDRLKEHCDALNARIDATKGQIDYMDAVSESAECLEDMADVEEYEGRVTQLNTLRSERNSVATELNTAQRRVNTAQTNLSAASRARETLQNNINTASNQANTASINMLTAAKRLCTEASKKLWAVLAANPIGAVVAVLGAMYYAVTKLIISEGKAAEMSEKFGESTSRQISRLDALCDIVAGTTRGTQTYKTALGELNEELRKCGVEQVKESDNLDAINEKRRQAIELIKQEAIERNRANQIQANDESYQSGLKDARLQLEKDLSVANTGSIVQIANNEIRSRPTQLAGIISDVVTQNVHTLAGKTGKEYEEALQNIYAKLREQSRTIGLSDETVNSVWLKLGFGDSDFLKTYIENVVELTEKHDDTRTAIDETAESLRSAETSSMSYAEKVAFTSRKLALCSGDVNTLYSSIQDLMSKYKDNTIGFSIRFQADNPPKWMEQLSDSELSRLATKFAAIGNSLNAGQTTLINGKVYTKQEALQRGADYAQTLKNRADRNKEAQSRSAQLETEIKTKKEDLKKYKKATKEAKAIEADIARLQAELDGYADYDRDHKKSGPTAAQLQAKEEDAAGKLADILRKQAQERLRIEQDYEYERWQSRISLMQEGEAKVIAQQELDFDREKTNLQRRLESDLEAELNRQMAVFDAEQDRLAAANKKYAKKTFRDSDVDESAMDAIKARYKALEDDLTNSQAKSQSDRLAAAKDAMNKYLSEYGSYQQRRQAIAADYGKRVEEAENAAVRLQLEAERDARISEVDYDEWVNTGDIVLAFGDLAELSNETIERLIADMEEYREKIIATFDPEKIQKYQEALDGLRNAEIANAFGVFGSAVPEYFARRLAIQKQINDQEQIGRNLARERQSLDMRILSQQGVVTLAARNAGVKVSAQDMGDIARIQELADRVAVSAANGDEFAKVLHQALLKLIGLNAEAERLAKVTKQWDGNFSHLKESLASLDGEKRFKAICEAVESAAGMVGDLAGQASELADAMGAEGLGKALGTLGEAMGSVQNVASGFAKGGLVGGIAAAAGEAMKWAAKLFAAGDASHERKIRRLQEQIDALGKSYERVGEAADKAFSTDASALINQQNTLLRQQQALIRQQIAEEEAKKKTDKDKVKNYQEQLEEINKTLAENADKAKEAIVGKDVKSAIEEFASLYAEAWNDGTNTAQKSVAAVRSLITGALSELLKKNIQPAAQSFYDTLAEAMEDGILTESELASLDAIKAQLDILAAAVEQQYNEIQQRYKDLDELREELTDISFDSVRDNFKSLLSDMTSTTEDFTENWTDMVRNALIEGLMNSKYDAMLKEWYDEFAEAMNDRQLTDSERDALRQQYDAIIQQGIADRNAVNDIVGGGAYSQQASSGSAWNMNQETGEELNGRFTAMVELEAANNVLVSDGNTITREILATLRSMAGISMLTADNGDNDALLAIRDMMFLSTGYLENIEKYSRYLSAMAADVSEMKTAIKNL